MYFLDTCICIDFMHGRLPHAYDMMSKSDKSLFKIPSIVKAELDFGVMKSMKKEGTRFALAEFLLPFEIVPFDENCASSYGRIRAYLEQTGQQISPNDTLIAAMALANNAVLVTGNLREFSRVPDLQVENWAEIDFPE